MADDIHAARLAAAQTVFRVVPATSAEKETDLTTVTTPAVHPSEEILDRFWRRVDELTTRYYDASHVWIVGTEIKAWNWENREACTPCVKSRMGKICIVDDDRPSCRTCRKAKIGCNRKPQFVFDMTKYDFFPSYQQFLAIFQDKSGHRKRHKRRTRRQSGQRKKAEGTRRRLQGEIGAVRPAACVQRYPFTSDAGARNNIAQVVHALTSRILPILPTMSEDLRVVNETINTHLLECIALGLRAVPVSDGDGSRLTGTGPVRHAKKCPPATDGYGTGWTRRRHTRPRPSTG
ncbi:hypothetical protein DFH06DRAFT_1402685 [Mycena polygramma]|nr:hypothetical protein DFH06DRAFT_1402685 [Mycena polygramma]